MATYFGEVQELSSRAVETEESSDQPSYKLSMVNNENFTNNIQCDSAIFCIGNIAIAFSKSYLTSGDSKLLFSISCESENKENYPLLYGNFRYQNNRNAAVIYITESQVPVCEINACAPEAVHVELCELILKYIQCSSAIILTSTPAVAYKGHLPCQDTPFLTCLATSKYPSPPYSTIPHLPSPNFVSGFAAAVLTEFEVRKKPALCVMNFTESSMMDVSNIAIYEKLQLIEVIKKLIQNDSKLKLVNYVQKNSISSNLYT